MECSVLCILEFSKDLTCLHSPHGLHGPIPISRQISQLKLSMRLSACDRDKTVW